MICKEAEGVKQATWDNLPSVVEKAFEANGEKLSAIITKHLDYIKNKDFHQFQSEYTDDNGQLMSMHAARSSSPADPLHQDPPWRMTEELLLEREHRGVCRSADVRAFSYCILKVWAISLWV